MPAITTLPTPALQRRWKKLPGTPDGDAGDPYCPLPLVDDLRNGFAFNEPLIAAKQSAYDRFSRTEQSLWVKQTGETTFDPRVHVQWGYDRNSLRTWRKDLLAPATTQQDQAFLYDQLQQIVNRQRGVLNINHTAAGGIPAETEAWDHDDQGNCPRSQTRDDLRSGFACNEPLIAAKQWKRYDTTEDGQPAIEQTRGHNTSNQPSDRIGSEIASPALGAARRAGVAMTCNFRQITKIDGSSANVAHDANGNMTLVPTSAPTGPQGNLEGPPLKTTWDAWNRTRLVHDHNDVLIQDNRYDGLTRRTQEITAAGTRHFYYNDQWRSVEERLDTATTPERQHIWHPADRWTLICRDHDTNGNGTLDEHLWCLKDDLDPVAIADQTGAIAERYAFSAFGIATILTPGFEPRFANESSFHWNLLFHGEFEDTVTGWMDYGFRLFVPELGRWLGRDPITRADQNNLYLFALNRSAGLLDNLGESPLDYHEVDDPVKFAEDNIPVVNLPKPFSVEGIDSRADLDAVRDWLGFWLAIAAWKATHHRDATPEDFDEYGGMGCYRCCYRNEERIYEFTYTGPLKGQGRTYSHFTVDPESGKRFAGFCPDGWIALVSYHSHYGNPTTQASDSDWSRFRRDTRAANEALRSDDEEFPSASQMPDQYTPEYTSGMFDRNSLSVTRIPFPIARFFEAPERPETGNKSCAPIDE